MLREKDVNGMLGKLFHVRIVNASIENWKEKYDGGKTIAVIKVEFLDGPLSHEYEYERINFEIELEV